MDMVMLSFAQGERLIAMTPVVGIFQLNESLVPSGRAFGQSHMAITFPTSALFNFTTNPEGVTKVFELSVHQQEDDRSFVSSCATHGHILHHRFNRT